MATLITISGIVLYLIIGAALRTFIKTKDYDSDLALFNGIFWPLAITIWSGIFLSRKITSLSENKKKKVKKIEKVPDKSYRIIERKNASGSVYFIPRFFNFYDGGWQDFIAYETDDEKSIIFVTRARGYSKNRRVDIRPISFEEAIELVEKHRDYMRKQEEEKNNLEYAQIIWEE